MNTSIQEVFESVEEPLKTATVRNVYGDPVESHGKTIIPVARIAYGFGAGAGTGHDHQAKGNEHQGGGGGGGMMAIPWGVVEISDGRTQVVRFSDIRRFVGALGLGLL